MRACLAIPAYSALLLVSGVAEAKFSVAVMPSFLEVKVAPGESRTEEVSVLNRGGDSLQAQPFVFDWLSNGDGKYTAAPGGSVPETVTPWITVRPSLVLVPPGREGRFFVTVAVPEGTVGGRQATLYLRSRQASNDGVNLMPVGAQLPIRILIDTGTGAPRLTVRVAAVTPPSPTKKLTFDLEVKNSGDVYLWAEPTVEVIGPLNDFVASLSPNLSKILLMPGQTEHSFLEWAGDLPPARYTGLCTVYYAGQQAAVEEAEFVVEEAPPVSAPQEATISHVSGANSATMPPRSPLYESGLPGADDGTAPKQSGKKTKSKKSKSAKGKKSRAGR